MLHILCMLVPWVAGFRTSTCTNDHEEFSLCSWRCPPTCVNMKLLIQPGVYCPYKWECQIGCRCTAGYIRDEYTKKCVSVWECPGNPWVQESYETDSDAWGVHFVLT